MNSAAFSTFRKPYRRLRREGQYVDGMPKGLYKLKIQNGNGIKVILYARRLQITTSIRLKGRNTSY